MQKNKQRSIVLILFLLGMLLMPLGTYAAWPIPTSTVPDENQTLGEAYPDIFEETAPQEESPIEQPTKPRGESVKDEEFFRAKVLKILDAGTREVTPEYIEQFQTIQVQLVSGNEKGAVKEITSSGITNIEGFQKVSAGDTVTIVKMYTSDGTANYYLHDHYRLPALWIIFALFAGLAIVFGRAKGIGSLLGLGFSILVLGKFIVPQILAGENPLLITLAGALIIACVSLFLAHGFNRQTFLSLISTVVTLGITAVISFLFVDFAHLFGRGTEDAFFIQTGELGFINLRGLLLAGIVIGTLGVLDDITTAQTAVVAELKAANPLLSLRELNIRALRVGREHIASLVNTLVLAYAGASLPLFLLFTAHKSASFWVIMNSEMIAEEFVRTIIGSSALILAVPITTFIAARFLKHDPSHTHTPHQHMHS